MISISKFLIFNSLRVTFSLNALAGIRDEQTFVICPLTNTLDDNVVIMRHTRKPGCITGKA
ncbi:MAG: hypothetical protein LBK08_10215 [Treponema sp.]|jgi:hypothetical protein|nr:hypothetical protein [Treponema sp.]